MDHQRVIRDVTVRLPMASSAQEACRWTVTALSRHTPATISVLLQVHDRLRCVAATGAWQVFATVPPGTGIVGRVYATGAAAVVPDVTADPDYLPIRPDVTAELCVPVLDRSGRAIGVLDLQWSGPVDLAPWRETAQRLAAQLGARIVALGGPPAESRSEKLLRHAAALSSAPTEWDLMGVASCAAREVSTLSTAVLLIAGPEGALLGPSPLVPGELETRIRAELTEAGPTTLGRMVDRAHRYGAGYTLGEADQPPTEDYRPLTRAGVRTLVAVPVGPVDAGGVLLVADERLLRPDPTTVSLMELLAGQAWTSLDRLRTLARLREQASSDPLTGLGHTGPFGRRIAAATPGRTALLAIDVDGFKTVNDTYGHQAGDRVLVGLARALEGALRHGDELYRIGGDEFVAVIEVSRPEEAVRIAERLTEAARRTGRTISVGVALPRPGESPDRTLRRADQALYAVKRQGRDGVHLAAA
ncbi:MULTISPECIES: diguanylate cyclase [unclassified Micromonospora]|uniref:GGDEF domain-containing protein n=1 Tax=unclassified Micromonospora TaxID=2617518 RepID=UPI000EF4D1D6|nr:MULTISPECIES: sensor domain-containing diguanylate cyclase [unclassified Micromonospora]RLP78562.1 sensor domain-containing diguanylate cyclase [Micromonospora sp. BL4]RLP92232.1 sensor domain-containing diguanylate cyclase [Micromonospora sp. CV4]